MANIVAGVVKNGVIVPEVPLPEGTLVELHVVRATEEMSSELKVELEAWQLAGAQSLELVERLAREGTADEPR